MTDYPIIRDNLDRLKFERVMARGVIGVLALFVAIGGVVFNIDYRPNHPQAWASIILFGALPIVGAIVMLRFVQFKPGELKRLRIDEGGIQLDSLNKEVNYPWSNIASCTVVSEKPHSAERDAVYVLQLKLKDRILDDEDRSAVIGSDFGLTVLQLQSIVRAGVAAWRERNVLNY